MKFSRNSAVVKMLELDKEYAQKCYNLQTKMTELGLLEEQECFRVGAIEAELEKSLIKSTGRCF